VGYSCRRSLAQARARWSDFSRLRDNTLSLIRRCPYRLHLASSGRNAPASNWLLKKKTAAGARLYKRFTNFGQLSVAAVVGALVVNSATASEHRSECGRARVPAQASLPFDRPDKRRLTRLPDRSRGPARLRGPDCDFVRCLFSGAPSLSSGWRAAVRHEIAVAIDDSHQALAARPQILYPTLRIMRSGGNERRTMMPSFRVLTIESRPP
jgi:hypothetical protein